MISHSITLDTHLLWLCLSTLLHPPTSPRSLQRPPLPVSLHHSVPSSHQYHRPIHCQTKQHHCQATLGEVRHPAPGHRHWYNLEGEQPHSTWVGIKKNMVASQASQGPLHHSCSSYTTLRTSPSMQLPKKLSAYAIPLGMSAWLARSAGWCALFGVKFMTS